MFFEEHTDAQFFQFPDVLQTLFRISGEPGYGLYEDLIDPSFTAVRQHSLEVIPLGGGGSRDAFICIDLRKLPVIMLADVFIVIALLGCETVELVIGVGTDTAIGRNTQNNCFRL
jgi:hypothetical protein